MGQSYKIGVVGLWHLGEIYSAGLAKLGHDVTGFDENRETIEKLNRNIPPLAEPDLENLIKTHRDAGRLRFTNDITSLKDRRIIWITYDTPLDENDIPDTKIIFNALENLAPHLADKILIVVTSQIPIGTTPKIKECIKGLRPSLNFNLAYVPENLQLGKALESFLSPPRIVIGAESPLVHEHVKAIFTGIDTAFLHMNIASAEVAKHALNAFLATSISFINDIADVCSTSGADILDVVKALKSEPRIGPHAFLGAGLGFAGGTLGRDLQTLLAHAHTASLDLPVIKAVYEKNAARRLIVPQKLEQLLDTLEGKTLALFGLTYKAGTPTLRRSMALEIIQDLRGAGAKIRAHDPMAPADEVKKRGIDFFADPYENAAGAHALVFVTDWSQFLTLDFEKLHSTMKEPWVFFDTKNMFAGKVEEIKRDGFHYIGIGR